MAKGSESLPSLSKEMERWHSFVSLTMDQRKTDVGPTPREVVWEMDGVKLYHYSPTGKAVRTPLLIVYALINKPYILDLERERSVIGLLLSKGIDVYLIDWGTPTEKDRFVATEDYVETYLDGAVDWIIGSSSVKDISIMGYCLGGTLVSIYASLHPEKIRNLIVMAAPIQFSCDGSLLHRWTSAEFLDADKLIDAFGIIPMELFTWTFMLLNPVGNLHLKYVDLWENADDERYADTFLRMERWIRDGVPMTGAFYHDLIVKWYQGNELVNGEFAVGGRPVDLTEISVPLLTITGTKDHIVPPESTEALLEFVSSRDKSSLRCESGHIGLSVGGRAHREIWPEVARWLRKRAARTRNR